MPHTLFKEIVDIYQLPTSNSLEKEEITIGDLHGNFMKLMFMLINEGIATEINEENYSKLVTIYRKPVHELTNEDIRQFNEILNGIKFNKIAIRLIGDEFADRGSNDYFTLKILEKLHHYHVPVEIIISNHGADFLCACEKHKETNHFHAPMLIQGHAASLENLHELVQRPDIDVTAEEVLKIAQTAYKPHLKAISYSLSKDNSHITIYSHAAIGLNVIKGLARQFAVSYSDSTALELAGTIDHINDKFQKYVQEGTLHTQLPEQAMFAGYSSKADLSDTPLVFALWNRLYDHIERPAKQHNYGLAYVHGHDFSDPVEEEYVFNLDKDNDLGKADFTHKGTYAVLHSLKQRKELTGDLESPIIEVKGNPIVSDEKPKGEHKKEVPVESELEKSSLFLEEKPIKEKMDLSNSDLGTIKNDEVFKKFFQHLSKKALSISLHNNKLTEKSASVLKEAFSTLEQVTSLDLTGNQFGEEHIDLLEIFSGFREEMKSIDLSQNELFKQPQEKLNTAFSNLKYVTKIRLSSNHLWDKTNLFINFPPNITTIDLSEDKDLRSGLITPKQLLDFLKTIPQSVKTIDLSKCNLLALPKGSFLIEQLQKDGRIILDPEELQAAATQILLRKQKQFERLFARLSRKISNLKQKATEDNDYALVSSAATQLETALKQAKEDFFVKTNSSEEQFKTNCKKAIDDAEKEFKNHRGFWFQINSILRGILGVIAGVTIIPALVVEMISSHGYVDTFFKLPQTHASTELAFFKENLGLSENQHPEPLPSCG